MARRVQDRCEVVVADCGSFDNALQSFKKRWKRAEVAADLNIRARCRTSRERKRYKKRRSQQRVAKWRREHPERP